MNPIRLSLPNGMDKDTDIKEVGNGKYLNANNIRHKTTDGQTTNVPQYILGNDFEYQSSDLVRQNKQVKINVLAILSTVGQLTFKTSANGASFTTATFSIIGTFVETAINDLVSASNTALAAFGGVVEVSRDITSTEQGYVIIEIGGATADVQGIDWIIEVVSGALEISTVYQEAIPEGLAGKLKNTANLQVRENLFQFWTTQNSLPDNRKVINATNATPISITELEEHGLSVGDLVNISGVQGNTSANGLYLVSSITNTFTYVLSGSAGIASATANISGGLEFLSTGEVEITTATPHGITTGQTVYVSGSDATANGEWIALVTSTTTIVLKGSVYLAGFGAGGTVIKIATATHNPIGLGEIGVAEYNLSNSTTHTYTRLLRSTEFDFRTKKQQDVVGQYYSDTYSLYFDDFYNVGRVFNYKGDFIQDGALSYINSLNTYSYGNISDELKLILVPDEVNIAYEGQLQSGGALTAGNWRYALNLLTQGLEGTTFTKLSNPIPVYLEDITNPINILGNTSNQGTSKANQIRVSGINQDVYPFVQLVAINYIDGSYEGFIVNRYSVPVSGELVITHFGNENTQEDLDISLLNQITADIYSARSIEILDNRLIRANTTATPEYDLTTWAQTFNYGVYKGTIQGVGSGESPIFGEYQDPNNVFGATSGMLNETYRCGVELRDNDTGVWTKAYHIGDFTIDTSAITGRRIATLTDYNLTNQPTPPANADEVYYFYLKFTNIDFDYVLPNGKTVRQQYDRIRFSRAEIDNRTILDSGILCTREDGTPSFRVNANHSYLSAAGTSTSPSVVYSIGATAVERQVGILFSANNIIGGANLDYLSSDKLYTFGQPLFQKLRNTGTGLGTGLSTITELYGTIGGTIDEHNLDGIRAINYNELVTISGESIRSDGQVFGVGSGVYTKGVAFKINTTFITDTAGLMANDYGVYYYQYYRPLANQYGEPSSNKWIDLNASYEINGTSNIATLYDVILQDCFTQKSYIRLWNANAAGAHGRITGFYSQNFINSQLRNETGVVSQYIFPKGNGGSADFDNRINQVTVFENNEPFDYNLGYNLPQLIQFDSGYDALFPKQLFYPTRHWYSSYKNSGSLVDYFRTFLPLDFYDEDEKYGSVLNAKTVNGELYTWSERGFFKQFFTTRAQFNSAEANQVVVIGSGSVFAQKGILLSSIGLTQKWALGILKTNIGKEAAYWVNTAEKKILRFGVDGTQIISQDINGAGRMRHFLIKNLLWATGKDTPADDEGIHIGILPTYSEIYFTVRCRKTVEAYDNAVSYSLNDEVSYVPELYYRNFEQTTDIYKYINPTPSTGNLPNDTVYWEKIEHTNNQYYNEYTLVWDEDRNTFECFFDTKPTIWATWDNRIYSPRPIGNTNKVYLHDKGYYGRWYADPQETLGSVTKASGSLNVVGVGTSFLSEFQTGYGIVITGITYIVVGVGSNTELRLDDIYIDANGDVQYGATSLSFAAAAYIPLSEQLEHGDIECVLNYDPIGSKSFISITSDTLLEPYRIDFTTPTQISYLDRGEFENFDGFWRSPIKNDSTGTNLNSGDTNRLYGQYLKIKLTFRCLEKQFLDSYIVKTIINHRDNRQ